jgi:hypothetical protein
VKADHQQSSLKSEGFWGLNEQVFKSAKLIVD